VVAAVVRLKLIVDFLSAGIREDYWKGTPAVPDRLALYAIVRSPSLCLLAGPPRFFQIESRGIYPLNFPLATPVYLCVCVKHVNNELRDINVNMLYSI